MEISFDGSYDDGTYLYASSELYNGMLKLNKASEKVDYICGFSHSSYEILGQHHKVYRYKESLVFTPDNARGIHVYNMFDKNMAYYAIDNQKATRTRCIDSFLNGSKLWLIYAYAEHPLVIIDLDTWQMKKIEIFKELLPKAIIERDFPLFWSVFASKGNCLFGAVWHSSYIIKIDTETGEVGMIKLQDTGRKLTTVVYFDNLLWCGEYGSTEVTCWNLEGEFVERYILEESVQMHEKGNFSNLILCDKNICLVTNLDNYIYYLDREKKLIKELVDFPENFETFEDTRKKWRRFFSYDVIGTIIRLYPTNANMMLDIDVVNRTIRGYQFVLDEKYDNDWYRRTFVYPQIEELGQGKVLRETKQLALDDYIGFVGWMSKRE